MFDELISNGENSFAKDSEQCESHSFVSAGNTQTKKAAGEMMRWCLCLSVRAHITEIPWSG